MQFTTKKATLTDGSGAFDVCVADAQEWPAPSERTADATSGALNDVLEAFQLCGSDKQVAELRAAIDAAITRVLKC